MRSFSLLSLVTIGSLNLLTGAVSDQSPFKFSSVIRPSSHYVSEPHFLVSDPTTNDVTLTSYMGENNKWDFVYDPITKKYTIT